MRNRPRVTVLGSLNMDISVTVPRLPEPGATVLGSAARFTPGGKGANQAVAAARLGAAVRMAGCVGDDDFGRRLLAALREEKIDASRVRTVPATPTGLAMISVDAAGENLITVAPGANHEVGAGEVAAAVKHAVVTAGAHGAALAGPEGAPVTTKAFPVEAVDTVGAGDAFVGALAVALAAGIPAAEAVRAAAAAGAAAATRPGAQAGMPRPADILAATGVSWP